MKWSYAIAQKLKISISMFIVLLLVLGTNLLDKQHFSELQQSFNSVYDDRLVVENYLFQLSKHLQEKKQLTDESAEHMATENAVINESIDLLIVKYAATRLTVEEAQHFKALQEHLNALKAMEEQYQHDPSISDKIDQQHETIWSDLQALSEIQLTEGKKILSDSNQIIASSNITARLEIGILVIIGLIIQVLMFSSKSIISKINQQSHLN